MMKYVVILGDGMADYPVPELDGKTPLQCAWKPNIDYLAKNGTEGMVRTVPEGVPPGSDTANLSVMGYDPRVYYTGRSPIEAVSMGVSLKDNDVAYRCNLVTLSDEDKYSDKIMIDYSSDEISSEEAREIINEINRHFENDYIKFYPGISYRHCMVWNNGKMGLKLTPPHDILERNIGNYLPEGDGSDVLLDMMIKSNEILKNNPVNLSRIKRGFRPANSIWLWGEGKKLSLPEFFSRYKVKGSVISAVDLIKGIGLCAGMKCIDVEGVTGNINTNFRGKAQAALDELASGQDFVYVHIEAPDECGHRHQVSEKIRSIELIDELVVKPILEGLEKYDDYKVMVLPDHPTPLQLRTHTSDPVPFVIYQKSKGKPSGLESYDEISAKETGIYINEGYELMGKFINNG